MHFQVDLRWSDKNTLMVLESAVTFIKAVMILKTILKNRQRLNRETSPCPILWEIMFCLCISLCSRIPTCSISLFYMTSRWNLENWLHVVCLSHMHNTAGGSPHKHVHNSINSSALHRREQQAAADRGRKSRINLIIDTVVSSTCLSPLFHREIFVFIFLFNFCVVC